MRDPERKHCHNGDRVLGDPNAILFDTTRSWRSVTFKFMNWFYTYEANKKINDHCEPVAKSKVSDRAPKQLFSMDGVNFFLLNSTCSHDSRGVMDFILIPL